MARIGSPAPAAIPMAAVTQIAAAVVRPRTESRRTKISPAPRKPTPVTIWAATREGSRITRRGCSTSVNPYLLTSMNSAAPTPTRVWVRNPAKNAGLRTHTLVGVGAALFMLISKYGFTDVLEPRLVVLDPSRVAAQIVTGVGFLGAG